MTKLLEELIKIALSQGLKASSKTQLYQKLRKKLGVGENDPPDTFDGVYAFTLVDFTIYLDSHYPNLKGKILNLLSDKEVIREFNESFQNRNSEQFQREIQFKLQQDFTSKHFKQFDLTSEQTEELSQNFTEIFTNNAVKSLKPGQHVIHSKLDETHKKVTEIQQTISQASTPKPRTHGILEPPP
jgi:hypothetical protein